MLYQDLAFTMHGQIYRKSEKINKFKISAPTLNEKFKLSDRSYSILDIQDNFEYILKNHGKKQLILQ